MRDASASSRYLVSADMVSKTMSAWEVSGDGCRAVIAIVVAPRRLASERHSTGSRDAPE